MAKITEDMGSGVKRCTGCSLLKPLSSFGSDKRATDGRQSRCLACYSEYDRNVRVRNKEKDRKQKALYRLQNADELRRYFKEWRTKNPEKSKAIHARYRRSGKAREMQKKWEQRNRLHIAKHYRDKRQFNIIFGLSVKLRGRISTAIHAQYTVKSRKTRELLGIEFLELKSYLESKFIQGMTWDDVISGKIHIDHIKPCASFDLTKEEEQRKCFHYTNLQPLWAKDNLSKGASVALI